MPQIWLLLGTALSPAPGESRAPASADVIANGQFILTTREAYDAVGTHAAVRHEVAEDLALAQAYLRHGRRLHFAFAERLMETRMYQSLPQLIEGWSKNIYLGGRRSFPEEPVLRALVPVMLAGAIGVLARAAGRCCSPGARRRRRLGWRGRRSSRPALSALFWMLISLRDADPGRRTACGYPLGALMALYIVAALDLAGRAPGGVAGAGVRYGGGASAP